jgi:hypothetical protein
MSRKYAILLVGTLLAGTWPSMIGSALAPPSQRTYSNTRKEFAAILAHVRRGMSEAQVLELLGRPDDIRPAKELGEGFPLRIAKVLCYGTHGHLTFPTLGQVYVDRLGKVDYVAGNSGTPPEPTLLSEKELRPLLELLNRPPRPSGRTFSPKEMIGIVNALVPLGKERALALLSEYVRVAPAWPNGPEGLTLVPMVLFDIPSPPDFFPRPILGSPWPEPPGDATRVPRFPIVLVDDVPLLLVSDYGILGAGAAAPDLEYYRRCCQMRRTCLRPSNQPFGVLQKLLESKAWIYDEKPYSASSNTGRVLLINQLLRLVRSVHRTKIDFGKFEGTEGADVDRLWKEEGRILRQLNVFWDTNVSDYALIRERGDS